MKTTFVPSKSHAHLQSLPAALCRKQEKVTPRSAEVAAFPKESLKPGAPKRCDKSSHRAYVFPVRTALREEDHCNNSLRAGKKVVSLSYKPRVA
jgi:hypothetical protein